MLPSSGASVQRPSLNSGMAAAQNIIFHQKFCAASECRAMFFICPHCDRGHRYCSHQCRLRSRLEQQRKARRRHQHSPEGLHDHRDRQRAYRLRLAAARRAAAEKSVTDHTSRTSPTSVRFRPLLRFNTPTSVFSAEGRVVCRICGRKGSFLNPFHTLR